MTVVGKPVDDATALGMAEALIHAEPLLVRLRRLAAEENG
jgi:hypothetical protein